MGKVMAVCTSEKKGTLKKDVGSALFLPNHGIEGDAHAGDWHRQVSLLSFDKVEEFRARGAEVDHGAFGENIVVQGIDFKNLPVGTIYTCGDVVLEMTQIGKKCHQGCAIFQQVGDCIMPREGVFAKVLQGGVISVGDEMSVQLPQNGYRCAVITASDKGAAGEREDKSGPLVCEMVKQQGYELAQYTILSDDREGIADALREICKNGTADLIFTTGGTGLSPRDTMPEATQDVAERLVPGIAEALRGHSLSITPRAMLSRGIAAICQNTLIINLPGSPKAVAESLAYLLPNLLHGLDILTQKSGECARS